MVVHGIVDYIGEWTPDQIAGLAFSGVLLLLYFYDGPLFDRYVSGQQRKELGLCEECGGLFDAAYCTLEDCPCKGRWDAAVRREQFVDYTAYGAESTKMEEAEVVNGEGVDAEGRPRTADRQEEAGRRVGGSTMHRRHGGGGGAPGNASGTAMDGHNS